MTGECASLCGSQSCTNWQQRRQHPIATTWVSGDLCWPVVGVRPIPLLALTGPSRDLWNTTVACALTPCSTSKRELAWQRVFPQVEARWAGDGSKTCRHVDVNCLGRWILAGHVRTKLCFPATVAACGQGSEE